MGLTANEYRISLCGNENVLKLTVVTDGYIKNH